LVADEAPVAPSISAPWSAAAFGELTTPYRRALLVHCYRMLGSIDDAEDAVQEALARAWRGRDTFRRDVSLRAWLYRIATTTCLDAIDARRRHGGGASLDVGPWLDDVVEEPSAGPEARYDEREAISLAFLTILQVLPPRQRAVLILRDVLGWRATEVADLLETSVPSVNSALHRARTTVSARYAAPPVGATGSIRALLDRYVRAWESADIAGLVALLRDDAIVTMPPGLSFAGREAIGAFLETVVFERGTRRRLRPIRANGRPGFVADSGASDGALTAFAVLVLEVDASGIARIDAFSDPRVLARFPAGSPA
jgi:RNA polymerase sigma-70 factor (ECF subfamily)